MLILVINCGSSSAKYQLFNAKKQTILANGVVERIGQSTAALKHNDNGSATVTRKVVCADHHVAINIIVDILCDKKYGAIASKDEIYGIGHRVVHGGEKFKESTLITDEVVKYINKYSELAPLHNPPSLLGIRACSEILKDVPQVAVFDTSFHQTMPQVAFMYGLPYKYYKQYGIRKYGFHGTSHRYVSAEAARILRKPLNKLKLITCHLGNGCSMAAVDRGISVDTTMGFTPLEGLPMGTRSGDLDPAVILFMIEKENISLNRVNDILNKESGFLGISGVSNDVRDIVNAIDHGTSGASERSKLTLDMFIYRIKKYIGAYYAAMGGLDAIVFTAGISENNPWLVKRIEKDMKRLFPRKVRFMVVPTNEELLIAKDTYEIIGKKNRQDVKGLKYSSLTF